MSTLAGRGAICSSDVPPFLFEQNEKLKVIVKSSLLFNHLWHVFLPSQTLTAQGQFQSQQDSQLSFLLNARIWLVLTFHNFFCFFSLHYVNSKFTGVWFVTFLALRPLSTVLSLIHSIRTFDPAIVSEAIPVLALVFGRGLKSGNTFYSSSRN